MWWRVFKSARLPIQAPRYSFPHDSFFIKPDSRNLVIALLLTFWHRPCFPKCHQLCISCHCQPQTQNPAAYHSLAPLWYFILAEIPKKRYKSSISWAIWACKFAYLLGEILKKDRETWLRACDFTWFWGIYYLTRLFCSVHCFRVWLLYCELVSEILGRDEGSVNKRLLDFGVWSIVLPRFSIVSRDRGFLYNKLEDDIRSWSQKACSWC